MNFPDLFWGKGRSHFSGCLWEPNHRSSFLVSIDLMHAQSYTSTWGSARQGHQFAQAGMCVEASRAPGPISPGCDSLEDPPAVSPSLFHDKVSPFHPRTDFGSLNSVPSVDCCSLRLISDEHSTGCSWQRCGSQQSFWSEGRLP